MNALKPRMMISYRRSDSAGITGRIFDRLAAHFGTDSVFMDIDAIPLAVDFRKYIDGAMKTLDFVIAVIGLDWCGPLADGTYRISNPEDPVRIEIETAINNALRIVPVLVEGATMPPRDALPEALRDFAFINAAVVAAGIDFQNHVDRLIRFLEGTAGHEAAGGFVAERSGGNLPKRLTALIGRAGEIAEIAALLGKSALVTVTGAGGIGKTRTSLQVADDLRAAFVDGAWFVDLAPLRAADLIPHEIALALGVPQAAECPALDTITDYLKRRDALLVVDNCEHLIGEAATVVDAILRACPEVHVLATSREPLGIEGERVYRLPSLSVPPEKTELNAANAGDFGAVALFVERATSGSPDFVLTNENATVIGEICRRLDGIALAIELAAARVNVLRPREIRDHLNERFRVLTDGRRTAVQRQQTMRAAIDWSYDLLSETERTLFSRLAIFAGGWTLAAAESTCAFPEIEPAEILEGLSSLVRKSLVVVDFGPDETRYRMLESTRAYAAEKAEPEWARLSERLSDWVYKFTLRTPDQLRELPKRLWLAGILREIDNIRFALESSLAVDARVSVATRITYELAMTMFWYEVGLEAEGRRWITSALARVNESTEPLTAGRLWSALAQTATAHEATTAAERAVRLLTDCGTPRDLAWARAALAFGLLQVGRLKEAEAAATQALELYESEHLERRSEFADALVIHANILRARGLNREARELLAAALTIFDTNGEERGAANVRGNLAELEFTGGNPRRALQLVSEAAEAFRALGSTLREATALVNAATYHLDLREIGEAHAAALAALKLARSSGDGAVVSVALQNIAGVRALRGEHSAAARLIGYVDAWYRKQGYEREWGEQRIADAISLSLAAAGPQAELAELGDAGALLSEDEAVREALLD